MACENDFEISKSNHWLFSLLALLSVLLFVSPGFSETCAGGLTGSNLVESSCVGTDISPCHDCDVTDIDFEIRAPDDTTTSGWLDTTYSSSSGTCSSTCTEEIWTASSSYPFCREEGTYDARVRAYTNSQWETSDWNIGVYTIAYDSSESWCDCNGNNWMASTVATDWWNSSWTYRKKITFDNSAQSSILSNFPVLVTLNSGNFTYANAKSDGSDIRFVDSDNSTVLDFEVEDWNTDANSYFWVEVPQINASSSTDNIYVYYGNASATDGSNDSGTWNSDFKMVQHFNESSGTHLDSTSNNNDSSSVTVTEQGSYIGIIGQADRFDGADDNVVINDSASLDLTSQITIEAWVDDPPKEPVPLETAEIEETTQLENTENQVSACSLPITSPKPLPLELIPSVPKPFIKNAFVDPEKVVPGDKMTVTAEIESAIALNSVKANMGGIEEIELELIEGNEFNGTWSNVWIVHGTEIKGYTTIIEASDVLGNSSFSEISWVDPCSGTAAYETPSSTTAFSEYSSTYAAAKSIDGSTSTSWLSANYSCCPGWIYYDLGSEKCVSAIKTYHNSTSYLPQTQTIQVSDDASSWSDVTSAYTVQDADAYDWFEKTFTETSARYVRIYFTDDEYFGRVRIYETQIKTRSYISNQTPAISSVTDSPDPVEAGNNVTFSVDWSDGDAGELAKIHICKTDAITGQTCDGGSWCDSSSFATTDPATCTYAAQNSDGGTQNYYAFVCDDGDACSSSSSGTFDVITNRTIAGKADSSYNLEMDSRMYVHATVNDTNVTKLVSKTWHYVVMTYDGSNLKLFVDGSQAATTSLSGAIPTDNNPLSIGKLIDGNIDEVRISGTARSADWIKAQYLSMTHQFNSFGSEEESGSAVCCGDDGASDDYCGSNGSVCTNGVYNANHCTDGVQNCGETAIDCGGSDCGSLTQGVLNNPNGNQYISGTYSVDFNLKVCSEIEIHAKLAYSSSPGLFSNTIESDLNLNNYSNISGLNCSSSDWTSSTNCTYSWNASAVSDGNYYFDLNLFVPATDQNRADSSNSSFYIDNSAPTPNPATIDSNTADSNVQLTVVATSASDAGAGLHSTAYDFNRNSSWLGWQASSTLVDTGLTAATRYCYTVRYRDIAENTGTESSMHCIYTLPNDPVISSSHLVGETSSDNTVDFTASGGTNYYYVWNQVSDSTVTTSDTLWDGTQITKNAATDGNWYLHVISVNGDGVANSGGTVHSGPYVIDSNPPTPNPATIESMTVNSSAQITIVATTASDSGGLHSTPYDFNRNSSWLGWQASETKVDSGLATNTKYCYTVRYRDASENTGSESSVLCAYTLPAEPVPVSTSHTAGQWSSDSTIDFTCSGAASVYYYIFDQVSDTSATTGDTSWDGASLEKTATSDGYWYLHVISANADGNINAGGTQHLGPFKIDSKAPHTRASPPSGWQLADFNVQLYCGDGYITENLVSYWKLNESTGLTATDSQSSHNGSLVNFPGDNSQWVSGMVSGALEFDGSNDYVTITDHADLDFDASESFTIDLWFNLDSTGSEQTLLAKKVSSSGDCSGTASSCASLESDGSCSSQAGCSWDSADCSGTCTVCTSIGDSGSCASQTGCSWDSENCYGTATSCTSLATENNCASQGGCSWDEENCYGSCFNCSNTSVESTCNNIDGCSWDAEGPCTGTPHPCVYWQTSGACNAVDGCWWDFDWCAGTVTETCSQYSESICGIGGCSWDEEGPCSGTCTSCSSYSTSSSCNSQFNCDWDSENCYGTATDCTSYGTSGSCSGQAGCSWDSADCYGTCTNCSSIAVEGTCTSQAGCSWDSDGPCGGTETACTTLTEQSPCESQAGCAWSGAGTGYALKISSGNLVQLYLDDSTDSVTVSSSSTVSANKWHHIAAVFDRASDKVILYLDANLEKEQSVSAIGDISNTVALLFGTDPNDASALNGTIDDVKLYDAALSTALVEKNYASDGNIYASGCADTQHRIDSGSWIDSNNVQISTDGNHQVDYNSTDAAGNIEDTKVFWGALDKFGPATSHDSNCAWRDSNISVTLTPVDAASGVAESYYCVDDSNSCTPNTSGTTVDVGANQGAIEKKYVRFYSVDNAGHSENVSSTCQIRIDKQNPTVLDNSLSDWNAFDQTITLSCSDGFGSGCADTKYCIYADGDSSCDPDSGAIGTSVSISCDSGDVNKQNIAYVSYDNVDNNSGIQTSTYTIRIDKQNPVVSAVLQEGWQTADFNFQVSCDDLNGSGCSIYSHRIDLGDWNSGSSYVWISTDGNHQVDLNANDNVGNYSSMTTVYAALDKTKPSTSDNAPSGWQNSDFNVTLSCSDATSGCASSYYDLNFTGWVAGTIVQISSDGNYRLDYNSVDVAGNRESNKTTWVALDKTAPSSTDNASSGCLGSAQSVSIIPSDALSGVAQTVYCVDDVNSCTPTTTGTSADVNCGAESQCTRYLRYRSTDNAGNQEAIKTRTLQIDGQAPSTGVDVNTDWQAENQTITLSPSDGAGCGVAATYYCTDDVNTCTPTNVGTSVSVTCDINSVCQTYVRYLSADSADNNESIKSALVRIDKLAPVSSAEFTDGWLNDSNVQFSCSDTGSGCQNVFYRIDSGSWVSNNWTGSDFNVLFSADGNHLVEFYATDNVNNRDGNRLGWIAIDKNPPGITITDPSTDNMEKGTLTIAFTINKLSGSDINADLIVVDFNGIVSDDFNAVSDCSDSNGNLSCSYTELGLQETDYNLSVTAQDQAGNSRKVSRVFKFLPIVSVRNVTPSGGVVTGTQSIEFEVKNTMLNALYVELHVTNWFDEFDNAITATMNLDNYEAIEGLTCDDTTWWDWTGCTYSWDTTGTTDGNYFVDVNMWAANGTTASAHSTQQFIVDNTAPVASVGNVSSTPVYSNKVYLACSDDASGCKDTKWYYFNESSSCSDSKATYSASTTANFLDIVTDHNDFICLWVEDRANLSHYAASIRLNVETTVFVVSSIPSQTQSIVTQDLNNECTMYVDAGVTVECDFKSTIKVSEWEKDLNRVYQDRPELVQTPPKTIRVLVQNEIESFYHKDYFLKFESDNRTITSQGEEKEYPVTVVRRRVIPLITENGQLEIGTLIIKIRQR